MINTEVTMTTSDADFPAESSVDSLAVGPNGPNLSQDQNKNFGQVRAVRGIDLTIRPGEVVAIRMPNGAGRTTTIDMILKLSRRIRHRRDPHLKMNCPEGNH